MKLLLEYFQLVKSFLEEISILEISLNWYFVTHVGGEIGVFIEGNVLQDI